ncbi:MAG TPA: TetR/AcrR family transcriptional regulator C-terminal domain-containing protein [Candidatus Limnocylindrales bacterium]|nr:TetR/AcrR family transcriptional regulator C-terminal domain-containing protein [Candidatus Limnocylindrales bacterium]
MSGPDSSRPAGWRREKAAPVQEPLTLDRIVAAAIDLVDREGLDALSMRRLGTELNVGATTLYWHVKNKDELLDLAIDHILGAIPAPDPALSWREQLRRLAVDTRRVLIRHRNLIMVLATRPTTGPNAIASIDRLFGVVRRAGFEGRALVLAALALLNYASGYSVLEAAGLSVFGSDVDEATVRQRLRENSEQVMAFIETLPDGQFPDLQLVARNLLETDDDARFAYGLERLLDGLEADLATTRAPA